MTGAQLTFAEALDVEGSDTAVLKLINAVGDVEIATVYSPPPLLLPIRTQSITSS